ncbi:unnamed protein product, partial [Rotaria sp. Silwood1]
RGAGRGGMMV